MKLSKKIAFALGIFLSVGFLFQTGIVLADEYGLDATAQATFGSLPSRKLPELVGDIVGTALSFVSVIFFILMIYGGFLWMTARGNSDQEGKARDTIFGAVIGIIIVLAAYALTTFVFSSLAPDGGSGGGSTVVSKCQELYASGGLSCKSKSTCQKGLDAQSKVEAAYDKVNPTGKSAITYEPKQGDPNVTAFIPLQCPGGNDNVCCL